MLVAMEEDHRLQSTVSDNQLGVLITNINPGTITGSINRSGSSSSGGSGSRIKSASSSHSDASSTSSAITSNSAVTRIKSLAVAQRLPTAPDDGPAGVVTAISRAAPKGNDSTSNTDHNNNSTSTAASSNWKRVSQRLTRSQSCSVESSSGPHHDRHVTIDLQVDQQQQRRQRLTETKSSGSSGTQTAAAGRRRAVVSVAAAAAAAVAAAAAKANAKEPESVWEAFVEHVRSVPTSSDCDRFVAGRTSRRAGSDQSRLIRDELSMKVAAERDAELFARRESIQLQERRQSSPIHRRQACVSVVQLSTLDSRLRRRHETISEKAEPQPVQQQQQQPGRFQRRHIGSNSCAEAASTASSEDSNSQQLKQCSPAAAPPKSRGWLILRRRLQLERERRRAQPSYKPWSSLSPPRKSIVSLVTTASDDDDSTVESGTSCSAAAAAFAAVAALTSYGGDVRSRRSVANEAVRDRLYDRYIDRQDSWDSGLSDEGCRRLRELQDVKRRQRFLRAALERIKRMSSMSTNGSSSSSSSGGGSAAAPRSRPATCSAAFRSSSSSSSGPSPRKLKNGGAACSADDDALRFRLDRRTQSAAVYRHRVLA